MTKAATMYVYIVIDVLFVHYHSKNLFLILFFIARFELK